MAWEIGIWEPPGPKWTKKAELKLKKQETGLMQCQLQLVDLLKLCCGLEIGMKPHDHGGRRMTISWEKLKFPAN